MTHPSTGSDARPFNAVFTNRQSRSGVNEGLNVLFCDLVKHLMELGVPVRVYTTGRHVLGLKEVLLANGVEPSRVEIVAPIAGSLVMKLLVSGEKKKKRSFSLRSLVTSWFTPLLSSQRWASFLSWLLDFSVLTALPKLLIMAVLGPLALVTGVVALVAVKLIKLVLKLKKFVSGVYILGAKQHAPVAGSSGSKPSKGAESSGSGSARRVTAAPPPLPPLLAFRVNLSIDTMEGLYAAECRRLADKLAEVQDADTFFFFHVFSGAAVARLAGRKKTMVVFPDAVASLYPTRYPAERFSSVLMANTVDSVRGADLLVCYSHFVKERQLERFLGELSSSKRIEVIPQGVFMPSLSLEREPLNVKALNRYVVNPFPEEGGLGTVQFGHFDYVLYPTVDRPHKGTMTAVRAVEYLLREKQANVKLIITSHQLTDDVRDYILERHMHRDILCMPALPLDVLNKMLANACAVVHPSFAEGGDIFNFSRAVSHGTPAFMSDIPVVDEMFSRRGYPPERYRPWLFPAGDWRRLAGMLETCLGQGRQGVWEAQSDALQWLGSHSYDEMARQYLRAYRSLGNNSQ